MDTPALAALLRSWVPLGHLRTIAAAAGIPEATLRDQVWGRRRPSPAVLLAVGRAQARPAAEVSLACAEASSDYSAAELWRAVLGAPEGRAVGVLRVLGMDAEADLLIGAQAAAKARAACDAEERARREIMDQMQRVPLAVDR